MRMAALIMSVLTPLVGCAPSAITDVTRYQTILKSVPAKLTAHFPKVIPDAATNAALSYYPGFQQGGSHFQLRLTLPADEIATHEQTFAVLATHTFRGGDTNHHENSEGGVPTTFDYTNGTNHGSFADSFVVYVLQAEDLGGPDFPWNNGTNGGVAICAETNQIVYWCSSW